MMYGSAKSDDSVASKQIANAIWFLLKNIPQRKTRPKVSRQDAETQESFPKNYTFYSTDEIKNSTVQRLPWYMANREWSVSTMIEQRENNTKNAERIDQHPQEMETRKFGSPGGHEKRETDNHIRGPKRGVLKFRTRKNDNKAKESHGKGSKADESNFPSESSSKSIASRRSPASTHRLKKIYTKRKKDKESDDSLSNMEKRPMRKDKKEIPVHAKDVELRQTHASHDKEASKDLQDFTKSCCYLCAQNTAAIAAVIHGKSPATERDVQVSIESIRKPVETSEKSSGPAPQVRTVQSSVKVKTQNVSTSCSEFCAKRKSKGKKKRKKFKLSKFFPILRRRKCPARRTIACETENFLVQCSNSAKCKWTNECRRVNNV